MCDNHDSSIVELNRRRFVQATGVGVAGLAAGGVPIAQGNHEPNWDNPEDVLEVLYIGGVEDGAAHFSEDLLVELGQYMLLNGVKLHYSERQADLNPDTLEHYDAVMLYGNRTNPVEEEINALIDFVEDGGAFLPIHSASASWTGSSDFIDLVGGQFAYHGSGTMTTDRVEHPIFDGAEEIETWEETYRHQNLNDDIEVLATGSGADYDDDENEPFTWVRHQGDGRVFYTAWGHDDRAWETDGFKQMLHNAIRWASGNEDTIGDHQTLEELPYSDVEDVYGHSEVPYYQGSAPDQVSSNNDGTWDLVQDPLPVSDSMAHTVTPAEFDLEPFVSEDDFPEEIDGQILDMTFDAAGRCWLAVTKDYPNNGGDGNDMIVICDDTDGDGHADDFTIFKDGLSIPWSIIPYKDGVLCAESVTMNSSDGRVVYFGDEDGDDVAEVEEELFDGVNTGDTHASLNQLHYATDNWVYGAVGYSGMSVEYGGESHGFSQDIFRFKPDGSEMEYVTGTPTNTAGVKDNEEGLIFYSAATAGNSVTCYAAIPDSYYDLINGYSGQTGADIRGEELSRTTYNNRILPINDRYRQVDQQDGFTAVTDQEIYSAREFPQQYWNSTTFVGEGTGQLLATFYLEQDGSNYVSHNYNNLVTSNDEWFSPTYANTGPDGQVWMIDFYNFVFQHNPTPSGYDNGPGNAYDTNKRDDEHSRLYRVTYGDNIDMQPRDLSDADPAELIDALSDDNRFWRRTAQRLLIERGEMDIVDDIIEVVEDESVDEIGLNGGAINALWTLEGLGALEADADAEAAAQGALHHESAGVRLNAARVLPATEESRDAILDSGVLEDDDYRVAQWAFLKLGECPASDEIGAAIFEAIDDDDRLMDDYLPAAASIGAAAHAHGFINAYENVYGDEEEEEGVNILENGDISNVEMGPDYWENTTYGGDAEFHYTDEESHSGDRSIAISAEEGTDAGWNVTIEVEPDTDYVLSGYIKTEDVETADSVPGWAEDFGAPYGPVLSIEELANAEGLQGDAITDTVTGTEDWTEVSVEFNSMDYEELQINALFGAYASDATGIAYYDNISVVRPEGDGCELTHADPADLDHVPDTVDHVIFCDDDGDDGEMDYVDIMVNGDFEDGYLEPNPAGWDTVTYGGDAVHALSSDESFEGDYSLSISAEEGTDAGWNTTVEVEPDTDYTLAGHIKTEDVEIADSVPDWAPEDAPYGAVLSVEQLANDEGMGSAAITDDVTGTENWTRVTLEFNSGDYEELQINALFGAYASEATGTAYYDNIQVIDPEGEEQELPSILENGDFEEMDGDSPAGWFTSTYGGSADFGVDEDESYVGERSVRMDSDSGADASWSQDIDVEPGVDYEITYWIKTENFDANTGFGATSNLHELQQDALPDHVTEDTDWVERRYTFNAGSNTQLQFNLLMGGWGTSIGTIWYDHVAIRPLEDIGEGIDAIYGRVQNHLERVDDDDDDDEIPAEAIDPSETIELEGSNDENGWTATAPESIDGEVNPTLTLLEGEEYTVEWTNADGQFHYFAVMDMAGPGGNELAASDSSSDEGETTSVDFTVTDEMLRYECPPHPDTMAGEIDVVEE